MFAELLPVRNGERVSNPPGVMSAGEGDVGGVVTCA